MRIQGQKGDNRLLLIAKEKLVATPLTRKKTTLPRLLAKVRRTNIHSEVETDPPVGREEW